jgi:hypothetical protein
MNLKNDKKKQGLFHLLAITIIPTIMVLIFIVKNIYLTLLFLILVFLVIYKLFKKKL